MVKKTNDVYSSCATFKVYNPSQVAGIDSSIMNLKLMKGNKDMKRNYNFSFIWTLLTQIRKNLPVVAVNRSEWKLDMMHPKNLCFHHYVRIYTNFQPLKIHQIRLYPSMLLPWILIQKEKGKECLSSAECNPTSETYQKSHSLSWL